MRASQLLGERYKEKPAEANLISHMLLLKGGYIRQVSNGIYSLLPPAKRVVAKIERIIREEMDSIDGQEVQMPVVMPRELWEESGRYKSIGSELVRFRDRNEHDMLLGMTHEEAAVHLSRNEAVTYNKYPFMIYQFQTKFRDEPRARGGLIRVREFTMKDAYSFHTSQKDLENYYEKCLAAYNRIFKRVGVPEVIAVGSDTGMMGGSVAHEFMLLCDAGEDTIAICNNCDYKANLEVAQARSKHKDYEEGKLEEEKLEEVYTPDIKSIDNLVSFFGLSAKNFIKAAVFAVQNSNKPLIVFIRGDLEVNEAKLKKVVYANVFPLTDYTDISLHFGFIGPLGLDTSKVDILFDKSLEGEENLVCGANKVGYHLKGFSMKRDLIPEKFYDVAKINHGDECCVCNSGTIELSRGIEVGNIFQLGTKYTMSMNMTYTDVDGERKHPIMGCYGIGVGRLMASVLEVRHDDYGPIWPISIAPWHVHICILNGHKGNVKEVAFALYEKLKELKCEVIIDDRDVNAGVQFADADLLGIPVRVIVSPKNLDNNKIEISTRDKTIKKLVEKEDAVKEILDVVNDLLKA
ncbi:proline--tRNA ligase [Pseudobacteroides cellulosolvens]|uniref:Proline--tRNA ligase n=1 Tax=Pseudobacteroides cellulosolvens ATCC 35603 = DSM 2933 TaxID=398512 RepID=A0A0L6JW98_9FIRM|nr:proline--tRNA ligase [Pseudobacteroides cellulosolvens]KNY30118.1 Prolyl-tRNA synthetase [Pseudobacteroides cellulosolvens ATCC 35603 = DSM 2933]